MTAKEKYFKTGNLVEIQSGMVGILLGDSLISEDGERFYQERYDNNLNHAVWEFLNIAKIYEPINDVPFSQLFNLDNYILVWGRENDSKRNV